MAVLHESSPKAFPWTPTKQRAAVLVAEDELSDEDIAASVGVSRRSLANWKLHPDFAAQVGDHIGQIQRTMLRYAVAKKHKRIAILDDLHERQLSVIRLRSERYAMEADTPEAAAKAVLGSKVPPEAVSGVLVCEETLMANGAKTVKWSFDAALVKEIRATHEQAAKELGQWVDKTEVGGQVQVVRIVGADVEGI